MLGTLAAMAVQRYSFFGRESVSFLLVLPIALPGVLTGIALSSTFQTIGVGFGLLTIMVGHATFCVVIAYNNVIARLRRLPRSPEEASADLGADTWITFRRIRCRGCGRHAVGRAACLRPVLRRGHRDRLTAGAGTQTIPLWVLAAMQRPTQLPVVKSSRSSWSCSPLSPSISPIGSRATPPAGQVLIRSWVPIGDTRRLAERGNLATSGYRAWISRGVLQS